MNALLLLTAWFDSVIAKDFFSGVILAVTQISFMVDTLRVSLCKNLRSKSIMHSNSGRTSMVGLMVHDKLHLEID